MPQIATLGSLRLPINLKVAFWGNSSISATRAARL